MDDQIRSGVDSVRTALARECTEFEVGGFRPRDSDDESWIGRVFLRAQDEPDAPTDAHGEPMYALAQIYLPALPFVPRQLEGVRYLCVFIGYEPPEPLADSGDGWLMREYKYEPLVRYECPQNVALKPFAMRAIHQPLDFPLWDAGDINGEVFDEIIELENKHGCSYHDDIGIEHCYGHKFGGYPSFAQSGVAFG